MANNVPTDFRGKYVALGRSCTFRREAYVASDVVVVTGHARAERAKDNTTNLAVFSAVTFAQFRAQAQAAGNFWNGDLQPAKQLLANLSNGDLSKIIGAAATTELVSSVKRVFHLPVPINLLRSPLDKPASSCLAG